MRYLIGSLALILIMCLVGCDKGCRCCPDGRCPPPKRAGEITLRPGESIELELPIDFDSGKVQKPTVRQVKAVN